MPIEAGQQLLHYRLIEKIGEGGMGVVWKAEDTKLHRHIALKVLPQAMAADPDRRARFEREARSVAALNHPNIVTLHSVEQSDDVHLITMELVEGRTLTQLLPRNGFPLNRLLEIAIPLADAVSRAHRAGITHRDLKPDNIMIDDEGRLRVLDFGLAKLHEASSPTQDTQAATVTSDTAEGRVLGTVAYMSPEQAEGKNVDARSDIFSLGTILYEMATGKRPFQGDTSMSTIGAILKDEPDSVTEINPALPRHAGRILRRCLAKDPDRRYQTALDLRNELEELRAELSVTGTTDSRLPARRGWWPAIVVAAIAVIAVATWTVMRRDDTAAPAAHYVPRPVTATAAYDKDTSWSPDGEYIVFSRMKDGNFDIYVQHVDGSEAVARVEEPGDQKDPRWSPDGRWLAYVSTAEPGTPIFLVPPDGGTPRKLIETGLPTLSLVGASLGVRPWSADSRFLLVARALGNGRFGIDRVDVATGEATPFTRPPAGLNDTSASYSFDGSRVLLRRGDFQSGTMMTVPAGGGEPQPLSDVAVREAVWRPGDRRVLYTTPDYGLVSLVELDVATGATSRIFEATSLQWISVSPTDRIVYADFRHDQFLFLVDVRTGERRQLTSHTFVNAIPTFSPDGRTLAYVSSRTGDMEVWLHDLDSGDETRVTDSEGIDIIADWSPDGRRLLLLSQRGDGRLRPWVASADGAGGVRMLVDQPLGWQGPFTPIEAHAHWSPDGAAVGYVVSERSGGELWTVAPDGQGAARRVAGITGFVWYGDSRRVLVTRLRGSEKELVAVHLETGEERVLYTGALRELHVARDGSAVAFCFGRGHFSMGLAMLRLEPPADSDGLPTAIGEPEYVVRTEGTWHVHSGSWSPDGTQLTYVRDWDYGDIYELVESVDDGE